MFSHRGNNLLTSCGKVSHHCSFTFLYILLAQNFWKPGYLNPITTRVKIWLMRLAGDFMTFTERPSLPIPAPHHTTSGLIISTPNPCSPPLPASHQSSVSAGPHFWLLAE